jgi:sec-independent protein translocase protein TatB
MDLFGIGPLNLILILGVMLIVFGPERLPEMAARAGKLVRELRSYASDVTGEFSGELAEIQQHLSGVQDDLRALGTDIQQHSTDVGDSIRDAAPGVAGKPQSAVAGLNEPPPAPAAGADKVVPRTNSPFRTRVDDYKPGT